MVTNSNRKVTKSNRKISIIEDKLHVTEGLSEDTFQQMLKKATTIHSNIYTLSIFKEIRKMLHDIADGCDTPSIWAKLENHGEFFHFDVINEQIKGSKKSKNNKWIETENSDNVYKILLRKQLNNQDLALITIRGIFIYTIVEEVEEVKEIKEIKKVGNYIRPRYFWSNEEWDDHYKKIKNEQINAIIINSIKTTIQKILDNEFNDSQSSLPSPNFVVLLKIQNEDDKFYFSKNSKKFDNLTSNILNNPVEFSKFGSEILEMAVDNRNDFTVQKIFDKILDITKNNNCYYNTMNIISLHLPKLCDDYYSNLVMKYILHTSIYLLDHSVKNSTNTSLYAYTIRIKKSSYLSKYLIQKQKTQETTPTISFIVPFPKICKYQDKNYNLWNEMLYKPKSVLFHNIDSNNFYKWWNFAAVVDFKWNTFGKYYYYFIWLFYAIFYLCFTFAIIENNNTLFIITIILGFMHLYFEFRQFLWMPKIYYKDPGNLFGK